MKAAFSPGTGFLILAIKMSPTENSLSSTSLFSSINFPSLSSAKSTTEECERIINSLFTLISFVFTKPKGSVNGLNNNFQDFILWQCELPFQ